MQPIKQAGCLIIGDEVLNGKILDTNSHNFAKFCFNDLSIPVKKTIVCGDDKKDIIQSLHTLMDDKCDFIVTSGGIGPTHDDITYESIAEAFNVHCKLDEETVDRMGRLRKDYIESVSERKRDAFYRMATFPVSSGDVSVEKIFPDEELWVPIVNVNHKVYILPGVPQLFEKLLVGLKPHLVPRIDPKLSLQRYYVKTTTKESDLAPFLSDLQADCDKKFGLGAVKLGSYPHFSWKINTISIIGSQDIEPEDLRDLVARIIVGVEGDATEITMKEEELMTTSDPAR